MSNGGGVADHSGLSWGHERLVRREGPARTGHEALGLLTGGKALSAASTEREGCSRGCSPRLGGSRRNQDGVVTPTEPRALEVLGMSI